MNRLLYIFALAIFCTACDTKTSSTSSTGTTETTPESSSGATSIAGITPGKTTLEELRNLVINPEKLNNDYVNVVDLKGLENKSNKSNKSAWIYSTNGLVYRVRISIYSYEPEITVALTEKYGTPKTKKGGIKEVTCKNGLGASFQRLEGTEDLLWKPNAGIQAYFHKWAKDCGEDVFQDYIIEHVATVQTLVAEQEAERAKTISNKVDKAKAGL
jgi:hypothetical protein